MSEGFHCKANRLILSARPPFDLQEYTTPALICKREKNLAQCSQWPQLKKGLKFLTAELMLSERKFQKHLAEFAVAAVKAINTGGGEAVPNRMPPTA